MIERLCALLEDAGVDLSEVELRDVLWFAATTAPARGEGDGDEPPPSRRPAAPVSGAADGEDETKGAQRQPPGAHGAGDPEPGPLVPAGLYAPGTARPAMARPARAVGVRGVRALPGTRRLSRALRPLRRSVPSRTSFRVDETATAEWIAETGLPDVVLRPRPERWLSVALIVDDGPSMVLWQQLAAEVRGLLERQGTFRSVRTYGLDSADEDRPVLRARPYAPGAPRRTARQLTDTSGRTVMLVLSDGVGPGWRGGAIPRLLRRWARHSPVAVLQPLPARMWPERGMPTQRLLVDAGGREGAPGRALSVRHPVLPRGLVSYDGATPVPVLELAEGELGTWAALTGTGGGGEPLPVMLLDGAEKPVAARVTAHVPEPTAEERLRRFRGAASPEAQRLAGALATVHPLTLPVMRLVHQAGAGRAERFHPAQLAEVFLGGLLRSRAGSAEEYEFRPGVADLLLDAVRTSDALETAAQVTEFLLHRQGSGPEFRARLSGDHGDSRVAEEARPFAAASPELLARLGLVADAAEEDAAADGPPEREEPVRQPPDPATPSPAGEVPPRSYTSERVQPLMIELVRRFAADDGLPRGVRYQVDQVLDNADERNEESGWWGVRFLPSLAHELVRAGWGAHADVLKDAAREQIAGLRTAEDLESRNLRGHLALTLNKLGEHEEAERELRAVVAVSARVHGEEHDYTLFARSYLVDLLYDAGRLEAAAEESRTLLDAWGRRESGDHRSEVLSRRQVYGRVLLDLARVEEAAREFRAVAAGRRELDGPAHVSTVTARVWLAAAVRRFGLYDGAEAELRSAVEDCRPAESELGDALLTAEYALGEILDTRQRNEEAEALWRELVERTSAGLKPWNWRIRRARRNRVHRLRALSRYAEAEAELDTLVEETVGTLGKWHDDSLVAQRLRAFVLEDQQRYDEARPIYRALLEQQIPVFGEDHANVLSTRYCLATSMRLAGLHEEALAEYTELLADSLRVLGPDTQSSLMARGGRARALASLGRREEAEAEYRVVVEAEARVLGLDAPNALTTRLNLAVLLRDQERYEESEAEFRRVVEGRVRVLGAEAKPTLAARHSWGYVLNRLGRFAEAEREIRATIEGRLRVVGPEHANTLWTRHNLGVTLKGLGRIEDAEAEWRDVLEISERVLGDEHNCTVKTREALAGLRGLGDGQAS
ncbi:hypothetical protein VT50_0220145 [Streptomyces antioxidans]|uniref:Tetratricopeptide repeat protein n=1 Tax=Streptomyces antioxidans TaxID=1507734 RepID=A0A1V4D3H0_9ACTN|nr:SAV_2336 N-terminal domain-related protein [Streptomyces antioxidans]OPF78145.1 hypothetical protein VT50_0220145 [Streptomyces antioxidans]